MDTVKYRSGSEEIYAQVWVGGHFIICYDEVERVGWFGRKKKYFKPVKSVPLELIKYVVEKK